MKNKKFIITVSVFLAVSLTLGLTAAAAYDSSEDPIISLSYLQNIFKAQIIEEIDERISELEDRIADGYEDRDTESDTEETEDTETETGTETEEIYTPPGEETTPQDQTSSSSYEVIKLSKGDALYAVSACDIMLRSGSALCIAPDANQGIADYTSAEEILGGMPFTKNHMCLIPRGDGRGLLATSESVYIMIRGDYTIVEG